MRTIYAAPTLLAILACDSPVRAQPQPGTVLWTYTGGTIYSSPALAPDGTLYFTTSAGLCAITNNGAIASNRWTFAMVANGAPAVARDGTIFIGGDDGYLYAVRPDGTKLWSRYVRAGGGCPAIGANGSVYYDAYDSFYSFSPSGATNWAATAFDKYTFTSPTIGPDGTIYFASSDSRTLRAFTPEGGQRWVSTLANSAGDSPALGSAGRIYTTGGPLYAFDLGGNQLWWTPTNGFLGSSPIVASDGTIYVKGDTDHLLYALDPSGQVLWSVLSDHKQYAPPTCPAIDVAGTIYYCASNSLMALNPQGQIQWCIYAGPSPPPGAPLATTSPLIGQDGTIYAALGGTLYAVYGTNKLADSPWPMYRQNPRHTGKIEKPLLQQPKKRADANFQFQLYSQLGGTDTVLTSTDLSTWSALTDVVVTNVPMDVVDFGASNYPSRFYRVFAK